MMDRSQLLHQAGPPLLMGLAIIIIAGSIYVARNTTSRLQRFGLAGLALVWLAVAGMELAASQGWIR